MANSEQIKALLKSHLEGDEERFASVALQMAANAARQGQGRFAQELRDIVDALKGRVADTAERNAPIPVVQPRGELAGLLGVAYPKVRFPDMILSDITRSRLERILVEQRQRHKFSHHGLKPRRKILLIGPPGTGKTMSATAIAGELNLPLFTILLDGLITKYMGETAAKLRLIFDTIQKTRGVYLFDEFDAIGGKRGATNDVGEIRRVLNSFLQFLEHDESDSILICATNHPELLDAALYRRFDDVIRYQKPSAILTERTLRSRLQGFDLKDISWTQARKAAAGLSYGDLTRACESASKNALLKDQKTIGNKNLLEAINERRNARE